MTTRREMLKRITYLRLKHIEDKKVSVTLLNHKLVLQDQARNLALAVEWAEGYVKDAVRDLPYTSIVWADIALILPLLKNPTAVEATNQENFTYITSQIRYYIAIESLLLPENMKTHLKIDLEERLVDLYKLIIDFQVQTIIRFYRSRTKNFFKGTINYDSWNKTLQSIKECEAAIVQKFETTISNTSLDISRNTLQVLKKLAQKAEATRKVQQNLLIREEEYLQLSREQRDIWQGIAQMAKDSKYHLPMVASALHNNAVDQHLPLYQEGTRIAILNRITTWVKSTESETLFWVNGPASTKKSTITRTLAHSLEHTEQLGASYFFRRSEQGRNSTALFFPTLATQLMATIPKFKAHLRQSLENPATAEVETKALKEQFKVLIQDPVSNISSEKSGVLTRVIVVDALDEYECQDDVPVVLGLLSQLQEQKSVHLRVLLTSRSTYPIIGVFEDLANSRTSYRCLALDKEYRNETKDDISTFLKSRFTTIKTKAKVIKDPWPEPGELERLINLATTPSPLFIYTATLCRFVEDKNGRRRPLK